MSGKIKQKKILSTNTLNTDGDIKEIQVLTAKVEEVKEEYLVIIDSKNKFCTSKSTLIQYLGLHDLIKIKEDNFLEYSFGKEEQNSSILIEYEILKEEVRERNELYYHIIFKVDSPRNIEEYSDFLRVVRRILSTITKKTEVLWDGVGFYYAQKSYPLVYEVENLTRKLITKLMVFVSGVGWEKSHIPEGVRNTVRTNKKIESNYLYELDFKQLENMLFNEYDTIKESLTKTIKNINTLEELNDLKKNISKSNWNRFFSDKVLSPEKELKERLAKLYLLRCKVAHNNIINKKDFQEIVELTSKLKEILLTAIEGLKASDEIIYLEEDIAKLMEAAHVARAEHEEEIAMIEAEARADYEDEKAMAEAEARADYMDEKAMAEAEDRADYMDEKTMAEAEDRADYEDEKAMAEAEDRADYMDEKAMAEAEARADYMDEKAMAEAEARADYMGEKE